MHRETMAPLTPWRRCGPETTAPSPCGGAAPGDDRQGLDGDPAVPSPDRGHQGDDRRSASFPCAGIGRGLVQASPPPAAARGDLRAELAGVTRVNPGVRAGCACGIDGSAGLTPRRNSAGQRTRTGMYLYGKHPDLLHTSHAHIVIIVAADPTDYPASQGSGRLWGVQKVHTMYHSISDCRSHDLYRVRCHRPSDRSLLNPTD